MLIEDQGGELVWKKNKDKFPASGPLYYQYYKSLNPAASPYVALSPNLIFFANSLDPDEAQQFGPISGPTKCLAWAGSKMFDTDGIPELIFPKKMFMKKHQQTTKIHANYSSGRNIANFNLLAP